MIAAALVAALACPAQPAVREDMQGRVLRSRLVACVGGRPVVIRRASMPGRRTGVRIWDGAAAGRWVAWTELRYARGRTTGVVLAGRIARGRVRSVERRVAFRPPARSFNGLDVALTTRGELAWTGDGRLVTAVIGDSAARTLAHGASGPLHVEDDRTVRWWRESRLQIDPVLGYSDLRPWPRAGCPPRRRFRVIAVTDQVLVTMASYGRGSYRTTAVRACQRATGADPPIASGPYHHTIRVAAVAGEWVVLIREVAGRGGCEHVSLETYAAGSGRAGLPTTVGCDSESQPGKGRPVVVTASGVPAWIVTREDRWALVTTADRGYMTLDATPPGGLTGLTVDGTRVRWLHAGVPRSADLG